MEVSESGASSRAKQGVPGDSVIRVFAADCVLEMTDAQGARLRVELRGSAATHCETLAQALWSGAR